MKYIDQYKKLHKNKNYGITGAMHRDKVDLEGVESGVDYGCGRSELLHSLQLKRSRWYDPAIEGLDELPTDHFDLVLCTDVLEHIPEEELHDTLTTIQKLGDKVFFIVSLRLANEILPNGENAHCTVKPPDWWEYLLSKYFNIYKVETNKEAIFVWGNSQ